MPTTRSNLAQTPVNSDTLNWTGDLATMADSLLVIVPCADTAAGDTVATARAAAGFAVSDSRPLFIWDLSLDCIMIKDSSGWRGAGARVRHQTFISSAFTVAGGLVNWDAGPLVNQSGLAVGPGFATQGPLSGQITFNETGWYSIHSYTSPTASAGMAATFFSKNNGAELIASDETSGTRWEVNPNVPRVLLAAGDTVRQTLVVTTGRDFTTIMRVDKLGN